MTKMHANTKNDKSAPSSESDQTAHEYFLFKRERRESLTLAYYNYYMGCVVTGKLSCVNAT